MMTAAKNPFHIPFRWALSSEPWMTELFDICSLRKLDLFYQVQRKKLVWLKETNTQKKTKKISKRGTFSPRHSHLRWCDVQSCCWVVGYMMLCLQVHRSCQVRAEQEPFWLKSRAQRMANSRFLHRLLKATRWWSKIMCSGCPVCLLYLLVWVTGYLKNELWDTLQNSTITMHYT